MAHWQSPTYRSSKAGAKHEPSQWRANGRVQMVPRSFPPIVDLGVLTGLGKGTRHARSASLKHRHHLEFAIEDNIGDPPRGGNAQRLRVARLELQRLHVRSEPHSPKAITPRPIPLRLLLRGRYEYPMKKPARIVKASAPQIEPETMFNVRKRK